MGDLAISIDLGGTQLRAALVDRSGAMLSRQAVPTQAQGGPAVVLAQIATLATVMGGQVEASRIAGVGLASPGPVDTIAGRAISIPTLAGFEDYALRDELQALLPWPLSLEHDGISAAIGEWTFGAGKGFGNVVYVTVSTGIGGGVIADGKVLRGAKGMAGHVGHMVLYPGGEMCNCGNRGCFEAYGAGPFFVARARKHMAQQDGLTVADIFASARAGDPRAGELVQEEAVILGQGFASLAHLYSPDVIVMGGGLSNGFDVLEDRLVQTFRSRTMPAFRDIKIVKAGLGDNSGLLGVAQLVFQNREAT